MCELGPVFNHLVSGYGVTPKLNGQHGHFELFSNSSTRMAIVAIRACTVRLVGVRKKLVLLFRMMRDIAHNVLCTVLNQRFFFCVNCWLFRNNLLYMTRCTEKCVLRYGMTPDLNRQMDIVLDHLESESPCDRPCF